MKLIKHAAFAAAGLLASTMSYAAGTSVGTSIDNTATATYYAAGDTTSQLSAESNTESVVVQEIIDFTINTTSSNVNVTSEQQDVVVAYTVSNTGNGSEGFVFSVTGAGPDFTPATFQLYEDRDGNGVLDPSDIAQGALNANGEINLNDDETKTIFVVTDIPVANVGEQGSGIVTVASSTPGVSTASIGDVLPGEGDGGTDAVVAVASGTDTLTHTYTVVVDPDAVDAVTVEKSVLSIVDSFGNDDSAIPGATVTYQIVVTVTTPVDGLVISDTIPDEVSYTAGTTYWIASDQEGTDVSTVGGATHPADSAVYSTSIDANGRISLNLGDQAAAGVYTLQFETTIK